VSWLGVQVSDRPALRRGGAAPAPPTSLLSPQEAQIDPPFPRDWTELDDALT